VIAKEEEFGGYGVVAYFFNKRYRPAGAFGVDGFND